MLDLEDDDDDDGGGGAAWMATFADLATLLMTFFVLLLSFSNMDKKLFRVALGSVREALGVQFKHPGDIEGVTTSLIEFSKEESTPNMKVTDDIVLDAVNEILGDSDLKGEVEVERNSRGVVIRLKGKLLFAAGEASLHANSKTTLDVLSEICDAIPLPIAFEGHTDDRPIRTHRFQSNWELSSARATAVMRNLVERGLDPHRAAVAGYAHMKPIASNDSAEGRSTNRRVEMTLLRLPESEDALDAVKHADLAPAHSESGDDAPTRTEDSKLASGESEASLGEAPDTLGHAEP